MSYHTPNEMARAGCTTLRGIRHWEDSGLLGTVERSNGNTRRYTPEQLIKAKIIAAAQFGGFDLETIGRMLIGYDAEVYEALCERLSAQIKAAIRLIEEIPLPPSESTANVFDL